MQIRIALHGGDADRRSGIAAALASYLAGECQTRVAAPRSGIVCDPDQDHSRPGFQPGAAPGALPPAIVVDGGHAANIDLALDGEPPGETLRRAAAAVNQLRAAANDDAARTTEAALGVTGVDLEGPSLWKNVFRPRYLFGCLLPRFFEGTWREPLFAFSHAGRTLLREGYSAAVMRAIYDRDTRPHSLLERVFLDYPLHRGIYDRLRILERLIGAEIDRRLSSGAHQVRILTAPCGFADEVLLPLENLARRDPALARRVRIIASDLDPHGDAGPPLLARAARSGLDCQFIRGDLTSAAFRQRLAAHGPFDIASFIGFSTWLPKPDMLRCFRWIRDALAPGGALLTDSATPAAFSLSGRFAGFKANYYPPPVYRAVLDACGFDGPGAVL
ncbi:MAG: class I SAM-dependent methyltransferase, partial [Bryobacteraceae bacterium]